MSYAVIPWRFKGLMSYAVIAWRFKDLMSYMQSLREGLKV